MKFFLDFLPGLAFLVALFIPEDRQDGIYLATKVLIATSFLQIFLGWLITRKFEKQYVVIFLVVLILGSATLLLKDERFIKWKPTVVFWLFSLAFLASDYIGRRNLTERLLGRMFQCAADGLAPGQPVLCGLLPALRRHQFTGRLQFQYRSLGHVQTVRFPVVEYRLPGRPGRVPVALRHRTAADWQEVIWTG